LEAALLRFLLSGEAGLPDEPAAKRPQAAPDQRGMTATTTLQAHLDRERDAFIRKTLAETAGDKDEAARRLGISRATLYRELRRSPESI